jgi:hypothetical protein
MLIETAIYQAVLDSVDSFHITSAAFAESAVCISTPEPSGVVPDHPGYQSAQAIGRHVQWIRHRVREQDWPEAFKHYTPNHCI